MFYKKDRKFTDFVHTQIAIPIIYNKLNWQEKQLDKETALKIDMESGIDYIFTNAAKVEVSIQERFRDKKYKNFNDFTIRYRRDFNKNRNQHQSEFFKIKADYLVYGITNISKEEQPNKNELNFIKFAVINLKILYDKIKTEQIIITEGIKRSNIIESKLYIPVLFNKDKSSSFVAFDIARLSNLFSDSRIILVQKGFF